MSIAPQIIFSRDLLPYFTGLDHSDIRGLVTAGQWFRRRIAPSFPSLVPLKSKNGIRMHLI
ncbi:hypothetical protein [Succinatimonas hippei]|uniref:Uncharacterized protein n=1 Tax=Succinatimonas hippei (strain DSM 22608 / JCM 16073 / KCTC 15190 / YIT 12066) TaxID=762983 RepID=E8LKT6_SUCHY|nr:hypothetical protein [Succinatimonas hippei]EFY06850.1 hypothetical protein HMPREF9444_01335 [Succinatimonas hippei YIT 12066]